MKYDFKVYRDQGYSDQQIFDALAEKEPALKTYLDQGYAPDQVLGAMENLGKPEEEPGFFGNIATLTKEGAETALTAARLSGDVATGEFDVNAPGLIAGQFNVDQTKKPKEYTEVAESFAPAQQAKEQAGDWSNPLDNLGAVGKMIWNVGEQAVTNPKGLAYLTASQIANMAPAMAGMLVGAKGGAAAGTVAAPITGGASVPIGAVIGGVVGGFTGEWPMEAGSEFIGIIGKELAARELDPTEKNISDLLADKQFMEGAVSQARTKATVTSAIDAAMTMGAGRLVGAPGRAAEKVARAELGASATASEVAKRASEIVAARSLLQKTGNVSKAVGLDVAGGGLSEAGGQVAAYGEADLSDVGMEMLGELGGSGIEIPGAAWAAGQDAMKARKPVEPADILNAPDAEAATEAFVAATDQLVDSIIADELVEESAQPADVAAVSPVEQAAPPIQGAVDGTITPAEAPGMAPAGQPVVDNIPQGGDRAGVPGADVTGTPAAGVDGDGLTGAPTPSTGQAGIVPRGADQAVVQPAAIPQPAQTEPTTPTLETNASGKVTLRGVPMEKIQAVRDKLKLKNVLIGRNNAVFPKGTDINALKAEFGIAPEPARPKPKKPQAPSTDLLQRIKQLGGIDGSQALDITGEKRGVGGWKFAFRKDGRGLDDLAEVLAQEGFNIDTSTVDGGVQQLRDMIRAHVNGERNFRADTIEEAAQQMADTAYMTEAAKRAEELGIKWKNLSAEQLDDAIYQAEDDIRMAQIAEEEAMSDDAVEAFGDLASIEDAEIDIPFGDEISVDPASIDAYFGYEGKNVKSTEGKTGQAQEPAGAGAKEGAARVAETEAKTEEVKPAVKEKPVEKLLGTQAVAQRQVNAANKFIDSVMEQFGLTREEAGRAWDYYVENKLVKVDAVGGQYNLKDGRLWDGDAMRKAAGVDIETTEKQQPPQEKAQPSEQAKGVKQEEKAAPEEVKAEQPKKPEPQKEEKPDTRFVDGIIQLKAIPKNLTIENPATGKGKYNARKVMTAANQRVEKLEALKRCLS